MFEILTAAVIGPIESVAKQSYSSSYIGIML